MSQEHLTGVLPKGEPPIGLPFVEPESQALPASGDGGILALTPDRYWRLFNDPGLSPPGFTTRPSAMTPEAFLSLTKQVQAMAGIMYTLALIIPQIMRLAMPLIDSTR